MARPRCRPLLTVIESEAGIGLPAVALKFGYHNVHQEYVGSQRGIRGEMVLRRSVTCIALVAVWGSGSVQAFADDNKPSLSQQLANPIADLTSVPIQYNALFSGGRDGKPMASVLDIQPVIPFRLNDDWNLITRTILPVTSVGNLFSGRGDVSGLADTQMSPFLSPQEAGPGGLIWGVGAVVNIPTATDSRLGANKWGRDRPPWLSSMEGNYSAQPQHWFDFV